MYTNIKLDTKITHDSSYPLDYSAYFIIVLMVIQGAVNVTELIFQDPISLITTKT